MKTEVHFDKTLAHDELQIAAFGPSSALERIVDFAQKELFYLIGLWLSILFSGSYKRIILCQYDYKRLYLGNNAYFCKSFGVTRQLVECCKYDF